LVFKSPDDFSRSQWAKKQKRCKGCINDEYQPASQTVTDADAAHKHVVGVHPSPGPSYAEVVPRPPTEEQPPTAAPAVKEAAAAAVVPRLGVDAPGSEPWSVEEDTLLLALNTWRPPVNVGAIDISKVLTWDEVSRRLGAVSGGVGRSSKHMRRRWLSLAQQHLVPGQQYPP
jgi:hypothetical protein